MKRKVNPVALLPIFVFLVLYLGLGIVFEYIMKIPMGFYNIPIIVAFLVAILTACLQNILCCSEFRHGLQLLFFLSLRVLCLLQWELLLEQ